MGQLPLALELKPHTAFDSFVAGPNTAAVAHVRSIAAGDRAESVWLFGPPATGKSHLLAAACRLASDAGRRAIYVDLDTQPEPAILRELDSVAIVAIDGPDRVSGHGDWERSLFSLFEARMRSGGILAAARAAPRDCGFSLADLASRAAACAVYGLDYLGDEELAAALVGHAARRGLSFAAPEAAFLLRRVSRDLGDLTDCLDRIDRYALAEQRRVTVPLLREALGL